MQYILTSIIGTIPICIAGITNVSLYIHGLISLGAPVGSMIAVYGDETFVMLAIFPKNVIILPTLNFIIAVQVL